MTKKACLAQEQYETLKECLEKRVSECVLQPKCKKKRMTLCVWNSADEEADRFCESLTKTEVGDFLRLEGQADFTKQLLAKIEEYRVKIENREAECEDGLYLLFVMHKENLWKQFDYEELTSGIKAVFRKFAMESCQLTEGEILETEVLDDMTEKASRICLVEWRVSKDDVQSAKLLMQTANYDEKLFSSIVRADFQDNYYIALKSTECNAVREDFAQRFLKALQKQTSEGKPEEIEWKLQGLFYPEKYQRNLKKQIPNPTWLPMTGAEELTICLQEEMKQRSWKEKLACRMRKGSFRSDLSIKETMDILFGSGGYSVRPERLRKKIKAETIEKICEEIVRNNQEDIQEAVFGGFSLHDIIYALQSKMLEMRDKKEKHITKIEDEMEEVLKAPLYYREISLPEIYNGFEDYFDLFKDFQKDWMEYCWWNVFAKYLHGLKAEVEEEYEALHRAEIVMENSCIPFLEKPLSFIADTGIEDCIMTEKELRKKIQEAVSNAEFRRTDVMNVVKAIDKYFVKLNEKNVNVEKQPRIYMFASADSEIEEIDIKGLVDRKECEFPWKLVKSESVPAKINFQLRVYALE